MSHAFLPRTVAKLSSLKNSPVFCRCYRWYWCTVMKFLTWLRTWNIPSYRLWRCIKHNYYLMYASVCLTVLHTHLFNGALSRTTRVSRYQKGKTCVRACVCACVCLYQRNLLSVLWRCWLGSRKCIQSVKKRVVGCWRGYLSGARCRLAFGPADATATHCLLLW